MDPLTNAERETHINQCADNRDEWEVYSDDPVFIRKMDKIATAYKVVNPGQQQEGKFWRVAGSQISLRNPSKPRILSDEQRAAMAERMRNIRKS